MERQQPPFPGIEHVTDLATGEEYFRRRKKTQKHKGPTPQERSNAMKLWLAQTKFEMLIHSASGAWYQRNSAQAAEDSGQMVEYLGARGNLDSAEFKLEDALNLTLTRFKPIRSIDIVKIIKRRSEVMEDNLRDMSWWIPSYLDWLIDRVGEIRNLSPSTIENLKAYAHQSKLSKAS